MSRRCTVWRTAIMAVMFAILVVPVPAASAGQTGWEALRTGSAFVVMRHALAPGTGDPGNFKLDECGTQRNLSDKGRQQARRIGDLFRNFGIARADVWSSAWCRCMETAELLALGEVRKLAALNSFFRQRYQSEEQTRALQDWLLARTSDEPLVLVTHQVNITALAGIFPQSGELVFVEIRADKSLRVIDRTGTLQ